jgi:hypothetical protein
MRGGSQLVELQQAIQANAAQANRKRHALYYFWRKMTGHKKIAGLVQIPRQGLQRQLCRHPLS